MSSVLGFVRRNLQILVFSRRNKQEKADDALKFGILGAAKIAPFALILPAKSHREVIIQAVAARDGVKAAAYAEKHGIPQVFDSYQALLDDPSIDAVYIPLPNGLHFEWTLKALAKGKHVLLEKPSVSNAAEAELLFHSPLLKQPKAPVLLEASHYRFQASWTYFLSLLDPPNVRHATTAMYAPALLIAKDDIRFDYDLAGGALADLGAYALTPLRAIFGAEPAECAECAVQTPPAPRERCDYAFDAVFRFPNGGTGRARGTLQDWAPLRLPALSVVHGEVVVPDTELPEGQEKVRVRKIDFDNFVISAFWHRIVVEDEFIVRERGSGGDGGDGDGAAGTVLKRWTTREVKKAYTFEEAGIKWPSEDHWLSYRYQLEEFVNAIRGREGSGLWVDGEDSIAQMRMMDMAYAKSGLPPRKTSEYRLP